jgi:proline iminopeptidase
MNTSELFPEIESYNQGFLKVSDIHTMYYEEAGNPNGKPILFLHGGPGGGLHDKYKRYFDPNFYRIVLFDQRGCGKSTPHSELRENTTRHLISDIEKLREHLNIDKWVVFGGSWGSTLSLCYAIAHPKRVLGLILRGIFLCRKEEINWFYQKGAHHLYPDEWEKYISIIPEDDRDDLVRAYYKRLTGDNYEEQLKSARAWSKWEGATSKLLQDPELISHFDEPHTAIAFAKIECHYFIHNIFLDSDNYILENAKNINHIPTKIVHGRYDVVCPVKNAWDLHKAMPDAELTIIPDAGHSISEPGITMELIKATEDFKKLWDR